MSAAMLEQGFVVATEGSVSATMQRLIDADRATGASHGRVDLALCAGFKPPRFEPEEARQMLANLHFLLRPGGALLIGYPLLPPAPGHVSVQEMLELAVQAGFSSDRLRVHAGTSNMVNSALPVYAFLGKD